MPVFTEMLRIVPCTSSCCFSWHQFMEDFGDREEAGDEMRVPMAASTS